MTDAEKFHVTGTTEGQFAPVHDAFVRNFTDHGDIGAAVAVYHHGASVVDLVGGHLDVEHTSPYSDRALQLVFSTTKGATAACAALLIDRGRLDPDATVASYWPEFGTAGKQDITVRQLLSHQAGLYDTDITLTLAQVLDWEPAVEALASQAPLFEPGTAHGYHAVTFGYLVGELVRRITGSRIGRFFAAEIAEPLGIEFYIGLPASEQDRVAPLINAMTSDVPEVAEMMGQLMGPDTALGRALAGPGKAFTMDPDDPEGNLFNRPDVQAAEIPAANGITNAKSLARFYAALVGAVDGVRLISPETLAAVSQVQTSGPNQVLMFADVQFALGFMVPSSFIKLGGPSSIGHYGLGGSVGFADPEAEISFGYVTNKLDLGLAGDPRTADLIDALYGCL